VDPGRLICTQHYVSIHYKFVKSYLLNDTLVRYLLNKLLSA
jgi:hypothetical protein